MPGHFAYKAARHPLLVPILKRLPELRNRHFAAADILALMLCPLFAAFCRLESFRGIERFFGALMVYTVVAGCVRLVVFRRFQLYNRYWRYASVDELLRISLAVLYSTALMAVSLIGLQEAGLWGRGFPRSIPFIDSLLILLVVGSTRFSVRFAHRALREQPPREDAGNALVVGAGEAGQMVARELLANPQLNLRPVAFLDDDPRKQGTLICNIPVLGGLRALQDAVEKQEVSEVIIAMPRAPGKAIREVVQRCEEADVPARTIPGMYEILNGSVGIATLRNVDIEDLLRREPIHTDVSAVSNLIRGRRVLVTGGGGSIGSELCRQVLRCGPSELILLGHGENSVFEIHNELLRLRQTALSHGRRTATRLRAVIADVRFAERISTVISECRPDIIFHAAAHKHVPLMESNPGEAISNNVFGTRNLLQAALEADVERFVMISTDKAVNPTSIMGATKRAAELLVLDAARRTGKPYVAVRFGNVLGSRGSVVLTFKQQIARGGPVTVSHPEMARYFMTIPEAVQLVLQASVLGRGGEIFVLDMGEPVRIVDLARDLIELSGLEVGRDIDIDFTGIRPGEKLFEELFIPGEEYEPTHHEKILIARNASNFVPRALDRALVRLLEAAVEDDRLAVLHALHDLIPEFQPADGLPERARASEPQPVGAAS